MSLTNWIKTLYTHPYTFRILTDSEYYQELLIFSQRFENKVSYIDWQVIYIIYLYYIAIECRSMCVWMSFSPFNWIFLWWPVVYIDSADCRCKDFNMKINYCSTNTTPSQIIQFIDDRTTYRQPTPIDALKLAMMRGGDKERIEAAKSPRSFIGRVTNCLTLIKLRQLSFGVWWRLQQIIYTTMSIIHQTWDWCWRLWACL